MNFNIFPLLLFIAAAVVAGVHSAPQTQVNEPTHTTNGSGDGDTIDVNKKAADVETILNDDVLDCILDEVRTKGTEI